MAGFDPTNRELCTDGACIGVIGSDGRCRECGAVATSATTHSRLRGMDLREDEAEDESEVANDPDRELCPDEMCVGLMGSDGRCKECGRSADNATPEPDKPADPSSSDDVDEEDEFEDRRLCPDDMCVGLIGSDGRCKECGTRC